MKPIGPYVAARALPDWDPAVQAGADGQAMVQTLRATDRLTGMPVLVHLLPQPIPVPVLPEHPALLPYTDEGMDGNEAYLVTELPLHALPASDPLLAARGALAALMTLHEAGLTHGGVRASQLWSVDGRVALAGAGLPWSREPGSEVQDLSDLAEALTALGSLPAPLRPLWETPGVLSAREALAQVQALEAAPAVSVPSHTALPQPHPHTASVSSIDAARAEGRAAVLPHDGSPIVLGEPEAEVRPVPPQREDGPDAPWGVLPTGLEGATAVPLPSLPPVNPPTGQEAVQVFVPGAVRVVAVRPEGSASPPVLQGDGSEALGPAVSPVSAFSTAPVGLAESPQERRKRQNDERRAQAMLDAQAAAQRKALAVQRQAAQQTDSPAASGIGQPIQIGFDDEPLPGAEAKEHGASAGVAVQGPWAQGRAVERIPARLRRPGDAVAASVSVADQSMAPQLPEAAALPSGHLPSRRRDGPPIRIGWDEDDSWRVVRSPSGTAEPQPTPRRPWGWLVVAVLVIAGLVWAVRSWSGGQAAGTQAIPPAAATVPAASGPAAAGCCSLQFRVQTAGDRVAGDSVAGSNTVARLTVLDAPPGANLTPGQEVGQAPGTVTLPLPGRYRLRVTAEGYTPASLQVTVPTREVVQIDLGP